MDAYLIDAELKKMEAEAKTRGEDHMPGCIEDRATKDGKKVSRGQGPREGGVSLPH